MNTNRLTPTTKLISSIYHHSVRTCAITVKSDNTILLLSSSPSETSVHNAITREKLYTLHHNANLEPVKSADFSTDGTKLLMIYRNKATVNNALTGKEQYTFYIYQDGYIPYCDGKEAAFNPDGTKIVTMSDIYKPAIWNASNGEKLVTLQHSSIGLYSNFAHFSPDNTKVLANFGSRYTVVWNAITGKKLCAFFDNIDLASFSPDNTKLIAAYNGNHNSRINILDVSTGNSLYSCEFDNWIRSVAFSPDGTKFLVVFWDTKYMLCNAITQEKIPMFGEYYQHFSHISFSPDGTFIATATPDGIVSTWQMLV